MSEIPEMNNAEAVTLLQACLEDLRIVKSTLMGLEGAPAAPYLKKYSVIRASGGIESAFKKIIADRVDEGSHEQIKNFVRKNVRDTSRNPKFGTIEAILQEFDPRWRQRFSELINLANSVRLKNALKTLVNARNSFAHGGDTDMNIDSVITHFLDGVTVISYLDQTVHESYEESLDATLAAQSASQTGGEE